MNPLDRIERGRTPKPPRALIYGPPGVGKSTCASQAPKPIFVQTEDGLDEIDCAKFPLSTTLADVTNSLDDLHAQSHEFETVVIDSLDWLERLVWDRVCADFSVKNIEKADGGFARGYSHALGYWRGILSQLDRLRNHKAMVVVLVAHTKIEKFEDPEAAPYDRYSPRLHKLATGLVTEWCDAVLFATRKFRTQSEDAGFGRKRSIAQPIGRDGGDRIMRTVGGPSCVAKNRYGLTEELPLTWDAFMSALSESTPNKITNT